MDFTQKNYCLALQRWQQYGQSNVAGSALLAGFASQIRLVCRRSRGACYNSQNNHRRDHVHDDCSAEHPKRGSSGQKGSPDLRPDERQALGSSQSMDGEIAREPQSPQLTNFKVELPFIL